MQTPDQLVEYQKYFLVCLATKVDKIKHTKSVFMSDKKKDHEFCTSGAPRARLVVVITPFKEGAS